MPRFRPLQIVMVTLILIIGVSAVQLGLPVLASPDALGCGARSEAAYPLAATSTGADTTMAEATMTGTTTRVSVASNGTQGNNESAFPSISADGRYVAFESLADNLVSGDTSALWDVFVHDMQTGQTTRVSVASDETQGDRSSYVPSISAEGRYVAFASYASNLVSGDTNRTSDVFVHDRQTGQTTRVSVASDGTEGNDNSSGNLRTNSISANGRYVAFESLALIPLHITILPS